MNLRQIPIIPTIVVLAAVATMIALGFWQLDRADEKAALIAKYEAALQGNSYSSLYPNQTNAAYKQVKFVCIGPLQSSPRAGKNEDGQSGWVHVVDCVLGPPSDEPENSLRFDVPMGQRSEIILGWSREPAVVVWQGGDIAGTAVPFGKYGGKIVADPPLAGLVANAKPNPRDLPNNHMAYVGQWFFFALTALVIYFLAVRKKLSERREGED